MPNKTFISQIIMALILCSLLLAGCTPATPSPTLRPATKIPATKVPATITATLPPTEVLPTPTQTPPALQPEQIRITKYQDNYTAFKIELPTGKTIISDPFLMDEKVHADVVTESHQHLDHTQTYRIIKPFELINTPGSFEFAGVKITGIAGAHNKAGFEDDPENQNIIYIFDLGYIRIAQFASQGQMPSDAMFAQIGKADILIIQIYNLDHKLSTVEAQKIASKVGARIIIPAHGNPDLNQGFAKLIGAEFKKEASGIFSISRSQLDKITTPIVLDMDRPYQFHP